MAIIITNSFAAIAFTVTDDHTTMQLGRCAIANYFGRSNAIDYTVAINNQRIGNGHTRRGRASGNSSPRFYPSPESHIRRVV